VFLCSVGAPFLRPGLHYLTAARGAAVKTGRRSPPKAARSGIDGCEHGATLNQVGRPAGSSFFPRPVGNRTSGFAELLSRPAEDLTAGRKSNAASRHSALGTRHSRPVRQVPMSISILLSCNIGAVSVLPVKSVPSHRDWRKAISWQTPLTLLRESPDCVSSHGSEQRHRYRSWLRSAFL